MFKFNPPTGGQNSKLIIIVVAGLLLAGCFHKGKPETVGKENAGSGEGVEIEDRVSKLSRQFGVTIPEGVEKTALDAVDGSASSGLATRDTKGVVTVLANLPDISGKDRYIARLTGGDQPVVLGTLSESKGGWMIERSATVDPTVHKTVEVLKNDAVILRGTFQ